MQNLHEKFLEPKFFLTILVILCCTLLTAMGKMAGDDYQAIMLIALGIYGVSSRKKKESKIKL